jgi:hypothetical protein
VVPTPAPVAAEVIDGFNLSAVPSAVFPPEELEID